MLWFWRASLVLSIVLINQLINGQTQLKNLKTVAEWKDLEFFFPSPNVRKTDILSGKYIPGNAVPIDIQVDYKDRGQTRLFVTIPRFQNGIPITLGTLSPLSGSGGPIITAYPDYFWQNSHGANCDGITSVVRVTVDECKRLWVLDTGRIGDNALCPPQLLVFNLANDKLIYRYKIPSAQISDVTLLVTPIVNVKDPPPGNCLNTLVYMADVSAFSIIVFDFKLKKSWRVSNKLMYPNPQFGTFTIAGESFDLMDGIIGMTLSPPGISWTKQFGLFFPNNPFVPAPQASDRLLYFHALASGSENIVSTKLLDNSTIWEKDPGSIPSAFTEIGARGTQSAAEAMDSNGNLFFGLMNPISIACWNSDNTYNKNNIRILTQNDTTLQFISGLKIIKNRKGEEELWALSCRFQKIMAGTLNSNEVNYRILALQVDELLGGKKCGGNIGEPTSNFVFPKY